MRESRGTLMTRFWGGVIRSCWRNNIRLQTHERSPETRPRCEIAARFATEYRSPETRSGTASCGAQLKQDGIELAVRRMLTSDAFHDQASKALDNDEEIKLEDISLDEALERAPKSKWGERVLRWEESLHLEDPTLDQP